MERVKSFKFLGVFLDERITWRVHVTKVQKSSEYYEMPIWNELGGKCCFIKANSLYVYFIRSRMEEVLYMGLRLSQFCLSLI